jgi:PAS domain-containing protein
VGSAPRRMGEELHCDAAESGEWEWAHPSKRGRSKLDVISDAVAKIQQLERRLALLQQSAPSQCNGHGAMRRRGSLEGAAPLSSLPAPYQYGSSSPYGAAVDAFLRHQSLMSVSMVQGKFGLLLVDVDEGTVVDCNASYEQWTGWRREDLATTLLLCPLHILHLYSPECMDIFWQVRDQHLAVNMHRRPMVRGGKGANCWQRSRPVRQFGRSLASLKALYLGQKGSIREAWRCRWGDGRVYECEMSTFVAESRPCLDDEGRSWQRPTRIVHVLARQDAVLLEEEC